MPHLLLPRSYARKQGRTCPALQEEKKSRSPRHPEDVRMPIHTRTHRKLTSLSTQLLTQLPRSHFRSKHTALAEPRQARPPPNGALKQNCHDLHGSIRQQDSRHRAGRRTTPRPRRRHTAATASQRNTLSTAAAPRRGPRRTPRQSTPGLGHQPAVPDPASLHRHLPKRRSGTARRNRRRKYHESRGHSPPATASRSDCLPGLPANGPRARSTQQPHGHRRPAPRGKSRRRTTEQQPGSARSNLEPELASDGNAARCKSNATSTTRRRKHALAGSSRGTKLGHHVVATRSRSPAKRSRSGGQHGIALRVRPTLHPARPHAIAIPSQPRGHKRRRRDANGRRASSGRHARSRARYLPRTKRPPQHVRDPRIQRHRRGKLLGMRISRRPG